MVVVVATVVDVVAVEDAVVCALRAGSPRPVVCAPPSRKTKREAMRAHAAAVVSASASHSLRGRRGVDPEEQYEN